MNSMEHQISCSCGAVKGTLSGAARTTHCVCYCKSCQAFAHFLGRADEILDERGGSAIVQTQPSNVRFTQGLENLACMKLTEKGILRWYSSCCRTPLGNTLATARLSFVGLVHNCLETNSQNLVESFGPVQIRVHSRSAKGEPKPKNKGMFPAYARLILDLLTARLSGRYASTDYFDANTDTPVSKPRVLSPAELEHLKKKL